MELRFISALIGAAVRAAPDVLGGSLGSGHTE
jgi:hypothetical protein